MSRRPNGSKQSRRALRVWTLSQTEAAVPYLTSVVRSLREHTLEALALGRELERLAARPGRPDRNALIEHQEIDRRLRRAEEACREAAEEQNALDIVPLDAAAGTALVPFIHQEQLAWYIFNLHDTPPLAAWRFQDDPLETRRPLTADQHGRTNPALTS
jgi:hypothetical protein